MVKKNFKAIFVILKKFQGAFCNNVNIRKHIFGVKRLTNKYNRLSLSLGHSFTSVSHRVHLNLKSIFSEV